MTEAKDERPPAPVRRPKRLHMPGLEGIDFSAIDWDNEPMSTLDEAEAQARRRRSRLRRRLLRLHRAPVERASAARRRARLWRQRSVRGWSDNELWNLDTHLCQHLGVMLVEHARGAVNYPDDVPYEEWRRQVRESGEALLAYEPDEATRVADARKALHWVADNLVDLWD